MQQHTKESKAQAVCPQTGALSVDLNESQIDYLLAQEAGPVSPRVFNVIIRVIVGFHCCLGRKIDGDYGIKTIWPILRYRKRVVFPGRSNVMVLIVLVMLALTVGPLSESVFSQEASPLLVSTESSTFDQGPDGNLIGEVIEVRREVESGEKIDSLLSARFEPLHKVWDPLVNKLGQHRVDIIFNYTAMVQNSSDLIPGIDDELSSAQNTLSGGDADLAIKWHAYRSGEASAGYFRLSSEYRHAYSELSPAGMASQIGSLWPTVRGWNDYSNVALTELYWHQGTLDSPFEYRIGRVKNTTVWNGGKYIGGNTGFVGGQVTGTPALITLNSGWTLDAVYHPVGGTTHIVAGVFQANNDSQNFQPLRSDELIYALQLGVKPEFSGYKGRYHIFAWHVDETEKTTDANGFAVNAEHQFDNWTPFFRYSFGDQNRSDLNSHPIRQSANIGIGYDGVFGYSKDWVAIAASWAEPTDETLRDQYGLEVDYSFRLTPHSTLTPHVQLIRDPSQNLSTNTILIIGLRAKIDF